MDFENCKHEHISEGTCDACGLEVSIYLDMESSYSENHKYEAQQQQPFENDLKNLNIPEEVKCAVYKMAQTCPRETHRMGVRKQQIFAFIYIAYLQLGYKFDPEKIIDELKMTQRETNMALRIISGTSSAEISLPLNEDDGEVLSAPVVVISPTHFLEEICVFNNLEFHQKDIFTLAKQILSSNKNLLEFNPKHVALAIVKHYMNLNDISISKFAKNNKISDSILKQYINRIQKK
jgi:hypothetical protein